MAASRTASPKYPVADLVPTAGYLLEIFVNDAFVIDIRCTSLKVLSYLKYDIWVEEMLIVQVRFRSRDSDCCFNPAASIQQQLTAQFLGSIWQQSGSQSSICVFKKLHACQR